MSDNIQNELRQLEHRFKKLEGERQILRDELAALRCRPRGWRQRRVPGGLGLIALLVGIGLAAPMLAQQATPEPTQEGKPLSQWVAALKDMNADARAAAAASIGKMGAKAKAGVPALLESLTDKDAKVRRRVVEALHRVDATQMKAAIPVVIELLSRTDGVIKHGVTDYSWGARMLGPVAAEATPSLIQMLDQKDETIHGRAVATLVEFKYETTGPALIKALGDPSQRIRRGAAEALRVLGASAAPARPALIAALKDPEPEVRMQAVRALISIDRERAQPALPTLEAFLGDDDLQFRSRAVDILRILGPIAEPAVPALLPLLKDASPKLRVAAAEALVGISPKKAAATVPILAEALKQDAYRSTAVSLAGRLGPTASPLLPDLLPLLKHENVFQRLGAAVAVVSIDPTQAEVAVPVIVTALKDKAVQDPAVVFRALERLGPAAKSAAPALRALLEDPAASARSGDDVAIALAKVDPTSDTAVAYLRKGLKVEKTRLRSLAALEKVGTAAKAAVPELTELLTWDAAYHRRRVAGLLGTIGPDAKAAVPALKALLQDEDEGVRKAAAAALKQIDPISAGDVPPK